MPARPEAPTTTFAARSLTRTLNGATVTDGAGVQLTRLIGTAATDHVDPFLLFDVFETADPDRYVAGFPPHPHRGFETVTYMLAGRMAHRDSTGSEGVIEPGGVQWMTAGRGIVHSERPSQQEGLLRGIQVWINLPARLKYTEPFYREYSAAQIPQSGIADGDPRATVRVIAGTTDDGVRGPVQGVATAPVFLDLQLPAGNRFTQTLPDRHSVLLYVLDGELDVAADGKTQRLLPRQLGVLSAGRHVHLQGGDDGTRALLLAAGPLHEPVVRSGPFVMNTAAEIEAAFEDYRAGRLTGPHQSEEA